MIWTVDLFGSICSLDHRRIGSWRLCVSSFSFLKGVRPCLSWKVGWGGRMHRSCLGFNSHYRKRWSIIFFFIMRRLKIFGTWYQIYLGLIGDACFYLAVLEHWGSFCRWKNSCASCFACWVTERGIGRLLKGLSQLYKRWNSFLESL